MALINFGKKVEEDVEEAEQEFIPTKESLRDKRDSYSSAKKNTRRKKEPPRPWGRKERLIVFWVLLSTILASTLLGLSARAWKLPGFPRLKLPSIKLFQTETIIIEGGDKNFNSDLLKKEQEITEEFKSLSGSLSGIYGFYVIDLESGYSFGLFEDEEFEAASLIKLPVMAGMYIKAESKEINLDDKYSLKDADKIGGAGSLYSKPEGYETTYRNLINLMGKQSDNTAYNICKNYLGGEEIESIIKKIGMKKTDLAKNITTPKDIGVFFEELWRGNVISEENKLELLEAMTGTIYEQWLTAGVPEEIKVPHKFGRELHVVNDAGIVYTKKPYIAVIMTKGVIEREADDIFPSLSKIIFEGMNR